MESLPENAIDIIRKRIDEIGFYQRQPENLLLTSPFFPPVYISYDVFFKRWFKSQRVNLKKYGLFTSFEKDFVELCWVYTRAIALKFKEVGITEICFEEESAFNDEELERWERFFGSDNLTRLAVLACPWKVKNHYTLSLYNPGIVNYFAGLAKYDLKEYLDLPFIRGNEGVEQLSEMLDREVLTVNRNQLSHFIADILTGNLSTEECFRLVHLSSKNEKFSRIAANAITVLNAARVPFSGMDLSRIRIPRAWLKGAILHGTSLLSADLSEVNLQNAFLSKTILTGACMKGVNAAEKIVKIPIDVDFLCLDVKRNVLIMKGRIGSRVHIVFYELLTSTFIGSLDSNNIGSESKLAFSQDKEWLGFGGHSSSIEIWDIKDYRRPVLLRTLKEFSGVITSIFFSQDGKYLAMGTKEGAIRVLEIIDIGEKICNVFVGNQNRIITSLFFEANNFLVISYEQGGIQLWRIDYNAGVLLWETVEQDFSIKDIVFCGSNQLIACISGSSGEVHFLSWAQNKRSQTLKDHKNGVLAMAFSKNGQYFASASQDALVRLWDLSASMENPVVFSGHSHAVKAVAFIRDDKFLISVSEDLTLRFWDVKEKNTNSYSQLNASFFPVVVSYRPHSNSLFSSNNGDVQVWDTRTLSLQYTLNCVEGLVARIECSDNGRYLAVSEWNGLWSNNLNHIAVWDLENRKLFRRVDAHTKGIAEISLSSNGDYLVSSKSKELLIRKLDDWSEESSRILTPHEGEIQKIVCSPTNAGFVYCALNVIYYGVLVSKENLPRVLFKAEGRILGLAFTSNKSLLAISGDNVLLSWKDNVCYDLLSQRKLNFKIPDPVVYSSSEVPNRVTFSFEGSYGMCMVNDIHFKKAVIQIFDINSLTIMDLIDGHLNDIGMYCFNFTQDELATSSEDNAIKIWRRDKKRWLLKSTSRALFFFNDCEYDESNKHFLLPEEARLNHYNK